ncbi:NAD-dependent protein deacetylase hst4 [Paraphaeosphaeria sporulosa]
MPGRKRKYSVEDEEWVNAQDGSYDAIVEKAAATENRNHLTKAMIREIRGRSKQNKKRAIPLVEQEQRPSPLPHEDHELADSPTSNQEPETQSDGISENDGHESMQRPSSQEATLLPNNGRIDVQNRETTVAADFFAKEWWTAREVTEVVKKLSSNDGQVIASHSFESRLEVKLELDPEELCPTLGGVLNVNNVHLVLVAVNHQPDSSSICFYDSSPLSWSMRIHEMIEAFTTRVASIRFDPLEERDCAKQSRADALACGVHVVNWLCHLLDIPALQYIESNWWRNVISQLYVMFLEKKATELKNAVRVALYDYARRCEYSRTFKTERAELQQKLADLNTSLQGLSKQHSSYVKLFEIADSLEDTHILQEAAYANESNLRKEISTMETSISGVARDLGILHEKITLQRVLLEKSMGEVRKSLLGLDEIMRVIYGPSKGKGQKEFWGFDAPLLSAPLQRPIPRRFDNTKTLSTIASLLRDQTNIVTLLVPDFRSSRGMFKNLARDYNVHSGQDLFHASVYGQPETLASFQSMVRGLIRLSQNARPTTFHHLLAYLEHKGRFLRNYSQNIDGRETFYPGLSTQIPLPKTGHYPRTILLHGTAMQMRCTTCCWIYNSDPACFEGDRGMDCKDCEKERLEMDKRQARVGHMRPCILLYDQPSGDDEAVGTVMSQDLSKKVGIFVCVGSRLTVPNAKKFAKEMCARAEKSIWISRENPPRGTKWDVMYRGDCDDVGEFYFDSENPYLD